MTDFMDWVDFDDVDALDDDRTALWRAVQIGRPDLVEELLAAGADPALPMMSGWSPARLSLTTAHPLPTDEVLTADERADVAESHRLIAALAGWPGYVEGFSIACVAGVDARTAMARLNAVDGQGEGDRLVVGVTDVPGGCVLMQPWGGTACSLVALRLLSEGTVAYGINAVDGPRGWFYRDGVLVAGDLSPGNEPFGDEGTREVLLAHLYLFQPVAFCFAHVGLKPVDARALSAPQRWVRLPERYLHGA